MHENYDSAPGFLKATSGRQALRPDSAQAGYKIIADVAGLRRLETNYGNADHSAVNSQVRSSARCSR